MNSRETGCLGVAAALALSALAGDAAAEEQAVPDAPPSPVVHPRSAASTHARAAASRPRAATLAKTNPQLAHSLNAPGAFDAALAPLTPPVLAAVMPVAAPLPAPENRGADQTHAELREKHLSEAPEVPAPSAPPVPATSDEAPEQSTGDEAALQAAERLLGNGVPLQLLQSVIVPAARGVTIAEIQTEAAGAVTLSVRPTKITRGSGLVAVGRF